jgi:hypothetical protein
MTEDFKAEPTHPRWYHPLIRLFGGKVFQGLGIGIIVLFVIFSDDPWWGVKAIGFFGVVVLVTFVHSFITRLLFRFRGKRFPTDRSPVLEFVSIMTTGCIFVGTALSVAVALGNQPDLESTLGLIAGVAIAGGAIFFFRRQQDEGDDQPGTRSKPPKLIP